jgi:hypothetical protein
MLANLLAQTIGLICLSLVMNKYFKLIFKVNLPLLVSLELKLSGWLLMRLSILLVVLLSKHISIAFIGSGFINKYITTNTDILLVLCKEIVIRNDQKRVSLRYKLSAPI